MPSDLEPDELPVHSAFASLRGHVADAVDGFTDRVRARLDTVTRPPGPSAVEVCMSVLTEFVNLVSRLGGYDRE